MKHLLILFCFISVAATCQEKKSKDQKENPCDPEIICTMEFRVINLEIRNDSGEAIILDEFYSAIDGTKIEIPADVYEAKDGIYPVATDGQMKDLDFDGTEIKFFGLVDKEVVLEHTMVIGKDCCHIQLLKGEEKVILLL